MKMNRNIMLRIAEEPGIEAGRKPIFVDCVFTRNKSDKDEDDKISELDESVNKISFEDMCKTRS